MVPAVTAKATWAWVPEVTAQSISLAVVPGQAEWTDSTLPVAEPARLSVAAPLARGV